LWLGYPSHTQAGSAQHLIEIVEARLPHPPQVELVFPNSFVREGCNLSGSYTGVCGFLQSRRCGMLTQKGYSFSPWYLESAALIRQVAVRGSVSTNFGVFRTTQVLSGCVLQFSTLNICFSERGKKKKK
jgi:hypothetical protein